MSLLETASVWCQTIIGLLAGQKSRAIWILLIATSLPMLSGAATAPSATKMTDKQRVDYLLSSRVGVRTALSVSIVSEEDYLAPMVDLLEAALHKTVENGWYVDLPDVLLTLQDRTLPLEESVGTLTDITNKVRDPKSAAANGHYYLDCASLDKCERAPITMAEIKSVLLMDPNHPPTTALNPNRAVRLFNRSAVIIAYLSASQNPAAYAWLRQDGTKMTVAETVSGMIAEHSEEVTRKAFRACLSIGGDDGMQDCARAGIRQAMIERVRMASAESPAQRFTQK